MNLKINMGGKRTTKRGRSSNHRQQTNDERYAQLTKEQLRVECRKRGQKTTGNKIELLQRLATNNKMVAATATAKRKDASKETAPTVNGNNTNNKVQNNIDRQKQREREERETLVLWKKPIVTTEYFIKETSTLLYTYGEKILVYRKTCLSVLLTVLGIYVLIQTAGPHQYLVQSICKKILWCSYWIGLGILSSVGLGTGLHTFLLYLGPHIAQVTLAAYECESLNFPEPPYPDDIICPTERDATAVTILAIMSKVRLEAMCWGAGTALGELPPYFMARAARLSGTDPDDEDDEIRELEDLQRKQSTREELTLLDRGKLFVEELVAKVGFLGILACASIPNPLFDLAGITCGHFLVPFWTFFGATLLGKAVIKMHIQKMFVIIAFNETLIDLALEWLKYIPVVGDKLQVPFKAFLESQKLKLHSKGGPGDVKEKGNILGAVFEKFVALMILYFVVSIVNSFAQNYHKRLHKRKNSLKSPPPPPPKGKLASD